MIDMTAALAIVTSAVQSQLELAGVDEPVEIGEEAVLLGEHALIDSLGLVNVIIEVEQVLLDDHGLSVIVVDERAMSQTNSPFKSVESLAGYVLQVSSEAS